VKFDVIGFGAINLDKIYKTNKIVGSGGEGFITDIKAFPGGSAANSITALSKLSLKTGYIGKIGSDEDGKILLKSFENEGVDINGILKSKQGPSGHSVIFEDRLGEREIYVYPGSNDELEFEEIIIDYVKNTQALHLTSFIGERPFNAQKRLIELFSDLIITFDPGDIYASKGLEKLMPILGKAEIIFTNTFKLEKEKEIITKNNYKVASKELINKGVKKVAVKLGSRGCFVTDSKESYHIEPYRVKVEGTTGAGDAFNAGFIYGHLKGRDLFQCGQLGNFVASCCITKSGAREGLPDRELVEKFERSLTRK
jgi:ribokinase